MLSNSLKEITFGVRADMIIGIIKPGARLIVLLIP
jgi:hypothetical protein